MKSVTIVLIVISVVGMIGLPMGDPRFLPTAVSLELGFIALAVLSTRWPRLIFIPSVAIATIVMVGNTLSPTHTGIMLTLTPLPNALILIIGGYILQGLLIVTSVRTYFQETRLLKGKVDYVD